MAGLLGAVIAVVASVPGFANAAPHTVAYDAAPPSWIDYAKKVNAEVTQRLTSSEPDAVALRSVLEAQRPAPDQPGPPLALQLWVDKRGVISRVQSGSLAAAKSEEALRKLLVGRAIGSAPPKRMLLPLRLQVQLELAPDPAATGS